MDGLAAFSFLCHTSELSIGFRREEGLMSKSIADLEVERVRLISEMAALQDLRPGCVTGIVRRCGKPTCHRSKPGDPGHGPTLRLTYKAEGKTISEALSTPAALRKAELEIGEFRKYQQISRDFVEVN